LSVLSAIDDRDGAWLKASDVVIAECSSARSDTHAHTHTHTCACTTVDSATRALLEYEPVVRRIDSS